MPWNLTDVPPAAQGLNGDAKRVFCEVANKVLAKSGDEGQAIREGIAAAEKGTK